jgi:hypothetical protein
MRGIMMRLFPHVLLYVCFLSSCAGFVPTYDEAIFQKISAVNDDLDKISAAVAKVYTEPPPFSKLETYYIDATANLDAAIDVAEGRATYLKDNISGRPAELVVIALKTCGTALQLQMDAHRKSALNRQTLEVFATKDACAVPRVMESRLKKGE